MPRPVWLGLLGAAAVAALYLALAFRTPEALGFFGDDAVYATTARALAEGRGYRLLSLPGEPLQTKYPPLYPAVLSLVMRARPEFPANYSLLLVPSALAGAGAVALAALYWRRVLGASAQLAAAVALLAALSPALLAFTRYTMSELLYAFIATAALLCLDASPIRGSTRGSSGRLMLGALLTACAVLTRTIGISLAVAAVAAPLLQRRRSDALLIAGVLLACLAPWWSWQASAAAANGAAGYSFLVSHELGYSGYLPGGPLEALRVASQNLLRLSFGIGWFQLALPIDFVHAAIEQGGAPLVLLHAISHTSLLLLLWGFWRSARDGLRTLHLYAAFYAAMILLWTFSPYRFLVPWTPFLLYFAATGLRSLLDAVAARLGGAAPRAALALAGAVYATVFALFLGEAWRLFRSSEQSFFARELTIDWSELRDVERFLREHTQPDELIASSHSEALFMGTGRRGHYFWPDTDPVAFEYDPSRTASRFTILPVPAEARARSEDVERNLARAYREAGIAWYVEWTALPSAQIFTQTAQHHPGWLEPRYVTPGRSFAIYRVQIPAEAVRR